MKVYKVSVIQYRQAVLDEKFFTSREKAIGYVIGLFGDKDKYRAIERQVDWYNARWCYDTEKMFNVKNWNKYEYVIDHGVKTAVIDMIAVL